MNENKLLLDKHILLCGNDSNVDINKHFCGRIYNLENFHIDYLTTDTIVYIYGNIQEISSKYVFPNNSNINVIADISTFYQDCKFKLINYGEVPININNVGIFFRSAFDTNTDYYYEITSSHRFQGLTMSNNITPAYREGIYLTKVENINDELHFKLLRCSTNLDGPTDNFRDIDNYIVNTTNRIGLPFFNEQVELNHVLAQTYHNAIVNRKNKYAKISKHSDKTKDMPKNALMAFCSFYKEYKNNAFNGFDHLKQVGYDHQYKKQSILTKLRFELKPQVTDNSYVKSFDVILYPNSVFLMSLETNRLYTHEIIPPNLGVEELPTRLGYVIRTSNTEAIYKDSEVYIKLNNKYEKLIASDELGLKKLCHLYYLENTTIDHIDYENKFNFSMNHGDYLKPII